MAGWRQTQDRRRRMRKALQLPMVSGAIRPADVEPRHFESDTSTVIPLCEPELLRNHSPEESWAPRSEFAPTPKESARKYVAHGACRLTDIVFNNPSGTLSVATRAVWSFLNRAAHVDAFRNDAPVTRAASC